jgi:aminopeptidase N
MTREFKFLPEDFGVLPVIVHNYDLVFDMFDDHTIVDSVMTLTTKVPVTKLSLNAKDLEINAVSCTEFPVTYEYNKEDSMLEIIFKSEVSADVALTIITKSTCRPTHNILEGLYYDVAPKGCSCQQITQCQQWGFQRIVPSFDEMTAKCTYTTKIIADVSYTHLISNGDIAEPRKDVDGRAEILYQNTTTPMSTYLFFLGIGTYEAYTKTFEYPSGDTFEIELLIPPNSDSVAAKHSVDILYESIMWIHVFTGPTKHNDEDKKKELWELLKKRNAANGDALEALRAQAKEMAQYCSGYTYTGTIYREIGMQNTDFGGMENVGNTTIATNRIMPFKDTTDSLFEYMYRVKCHEFYHNLNGSEVTGWSPFEIWLNEAVTVHIEREFHEFIAGYDYVRLDEVQGIICAGGTLENDKGAASLPVEPNGFNDPNELITGTTYVKAPEIVRMTQTILGKEKFVKALDAYHSKFAHSNAHRSDWFEAMSKEFGQDLSEYSRKWLKKTGWPTITVTRTYNAEAKTYTLDLVQDEQEDPWFYPFPVALCANDGEIIAKQCLYVDSANTTLVFENILEKPAFVSLNLEHTMYGKVVDGAVTQSELLLQANFDTDVCNKYIAYKRLADAEKLRMLQDETAEPSKFFVDLLLENVSNTITTDSLGNQLAAMSRDVEDPAYKYEYQKQYEMSKRFRKYIAKNHMLVLRILYDACREKTFEGAYLDVMTKQIKNRQVQNTVLAYLAELDTPEIQALIWKQFEESDAATDKFFAFSTYMNSSASDKKEKMAEYAKTAKENLVRWEIFLAMISRSEADDVLDMIAAMEKSSEFDINQTNDQRSLFFGFISNKRKSLETTEGRAFLRDTIIKLGQVNEYTTMYALKTLQFMDKMPARYHKPLAQILVDVLAALDAKKFPSVCNTAKMILDGNPVAKKSLE